MQGGAETGVAFGGPRAPSTWSAPTTRRSTRVWRALTDEAAKQKWFGGPPGRWEVLERHMDVRVGGRERLEGPLGKRRGLHLRRHLSRRGPERAAGLQLRDAPGRQEDLGVAGDHAAQGRSERKTTLTVTEQGAFLDGYDDAGSREQGTGHLLDALGASLQQRD